MKIATNIQQSKKLAEILPLKSADMYYPYFGDGDYGSTPRVGEGIEFSGGKDIPAWSLGALLNLLPEAINEYTKFFALLQISKNGICYHHPFGYLIKGFFEEETLIDAAFEMVCWLKENKHI